MKWKTAGKGSWNEKQQERDHEMKNSRKGIMKWKTAGKGSWNEIQQERDHEMKNSRKGITKWKNSWRRVRKEERVRVISDEKEMIQTDCPVFRLFRCAFFRESCRAGQCLSDERFVIVQIIVRLLVFLVCCRNSCRNPGNFRSCCEVLHNNDHVSGW